MQSLDLDGLGLDRERKLNENVNKLLFLKKSFVPGCMGGAMELILRFLPKPTAAMSACVSATLHVCAAAARTVASLSHSSRALVI